MTRIAKSLLVLGEEVHEISPSTTLYFYDDTAHVDSDHDPNPAGVVCALDIMAGHGLDLAALAEQILQRRNPDLKYVIYNRRIASAASGWKWRDYAGSNPHTDHIHVSVGVGPDGYSRQPYDDTTPWLEADMTITAADVRVLLTTAAFPYAKPTQSLGTTWLATYNAVNDIKAGQAADKARDEIILATVKALPGGGGNVDTTALLAAVADVKSSVLAKLEAEVNQLQQERDELLVKLAAALS